MDATTVRYCPPFLHNHKATIEDWGQGRRGAQEGAHIASLNGPLPSVSATLILGSHNSQTVAPNQQGDPPDNSCGTKTCLKHG